MESKFDFRSIKTFEDACQKLGVDPADFFRKYENAPDHIAALVQLEVIIRALNDGWRHPLDGETTVYFPWFWIYSKSEERSLPKARKDDSDIARFMRPDGSCGLAYAVSYNAWSYSTALIGSRLACKSSEIARYCSLQFRDLWESWLFPQEWQIEEKNDGDGHPKYW